MITNVEAWITFNSEKEKLRLPVLPNKLSVSMGSKDSTIDIVDFGEVLIAKNRPLLTTKIESIFPFNSYPGVPSSRIVNPYTAIKMIERWKESLKPVHVIFTKIGVDFYARISKFTKEYQADDPGALHYTIELKEWRKTSTRTVTVGGNGTATVASANTRANNSTRPKTYTVKTGDCLWTIAEKMYGDGMKYTKIYNANKDKIRADYIIYTGQVLTIP